MKEERITVRSRFSEFLVEQNGLDRRGFREWAFYPGMLFSATDKWWGNRGKRTAPHEGCDFCLYLDGQGRALGLEEGAIIPVMYDGLVVRIIDDFLGKSIVVAHAFSECAGQVLLTIYGHTVPSSDLAAGVSVKAGEIIGAIAPVGKSRSTVLPHLHVSVGRTSGLASCEGLNWENMAAVLAMADPLDFIEEMSYRVIEQHEPVG